MSSKKRPYCESDVARVHEALQARFKKEPGSVARVERSLGVKKDYFSYHRKTCRIDHGALLATLRELDVDPAVFFAGLYGSPAAAGQTAGTGESPASDTEVHSNPGLSGRSFGPADPERAAALEPWIAEMDELRYDDCEAALAGLRSRAEEIPIDAGAQWLAVGGSCLRTAGDMGDAALCFEAALKIAPEPSVTANVLQRQSYLVRDRGEFQGALHLSERAGGIFARLGDSGGLGKTLVEQGQFLDLLGDRPGAIQSIREAMELVPEQATRYWQAIHQYMAFWLQDEGALEESHRHASRAAALARDKQQRAGVLWTQAGILERMGRFREAAETYASTLASVEDQPFEGLLTTTRLARARALAGAPEEAARAARSAAQFMGAFSGNRLAQALILELYRLTAGECRKVAKLDEMARAAERLKPRAGDKVTLGSRLLRARRRQGLSRRQVSKILGIAESSLLNIERGRMPGRSYEERITVWLFAVSPETQLAVGILR